MANYPALSFAFGSDETIKDGTVIDRAMSGAAKGRNLYTSKKHTYQLKHAGLTAANKSTLESFYDSNRALAVSLTWTDGTARNVILTSIKFTPWPKQSGGSRLWDAVVTAEEV